MRGVTDDERGLLNHISRWGSDGYPLTKHRGGRWTWGPFRTVQGPPCVYKTKRECVAQLEAFLDVLRDAIAGRI